MPDRLQLTAGITAFSADVLEDCAPVTVDFTNNSDSLSANVTYRWEFGTEGESTEANPSYTFTNPDTYDVSLTVTNDSRCVSTYSAPAYIKVNDVPSADFTFYPPETVLEDATVESGGFNWRKVRLVGGDEGWVAEEFLTIRAPCN